MNSRNRVYMVESYFMWLKVTELDEDRIIAKHFTPSHERNFHCPVGFEDFEWWYEGVYRFKIPKVDVTVDGDYVSYSNNSMYVIVEATSTFEAVEKAIKIFGAKIKSR